MRTTQQIADAAAKRAATQAANRANGIPTVRQQRAAKRAAKAAAQGGAQQQQQQQQQAPPPRPAAPRSGRTRPSFSSSTTTAAPLFAKAPDARALKLAALVALEAVFGSKIADLRRTSPVLPEDISSGWETYKKLKAHAIDPRHPSPQEAAAALTIATVRLVKLAF